jgi:hypothetical protein
MNRIAWLEKEGIQIRKDSTSSQPTCYNTLYSTLTLFDRLVTCGTAEAYTMNNILSDFEATKMFPLAPRKVFLE